MITYHSMHKLEKEEKNINTASLIKEMSKLLLMIIRGRLINLLG